MGTADSLDLPGSTSCPAGQVAVGIQGNESDFVNLLTQRCQAADFTGPITLSSPNFGGEAAGPDSARPRPANQRAEVKGQVLIAIPAGAGSAGSVRTSQKGLRFVPLEQVRQIPNGPFLDTRKGTVRLTTARDAAGTPSPAISRPAPSRCSSRAAEARAA